MADYLLEPSVFEPVRRSMRHDAFACFDFDGTLAPIVADPRHAAIPAALQALLKQLAERMPVAIVSGRDAHDVRARLGFEPAAVVGNHGADPWQPGPREAALWESFLDQVRQHRQALSLLGVVVEMKALSVAFHLREVTSPVAAEAAIRRCLEAVPDGVGVFGGKHVLNAVPRGAPDKSDAVAGLMDALGCRHGLYAGDDVNDEPVFRRGIAGLATVRIEHAPDSAARYFLRAQHEMRELVSSLVSLEAGL